MKVSKGDFIEMDYIGKIKETSQIFDLTYEDIAKKENIHNPNAHYHPIIICIGENNIVKGLDSQLEGKETGEKYTIDVDIENAFGKANPKLLQIIPLNVFTKEKINPIPGLQITMNDLIGTVRIVTGGRVMVDFNHPLAGKNLSYEIKINKVITDNNLKLKSIIEFHLHAHDVKAEIKEGRAVVELNTPDEIKEKLAEIVKRLIPAVKSIEFKTTSKE